jgi:hypothetical protein
MGSENLNLRTMDGTSLKKFDTSTVLRVAAQVIWYPTIWQMRALEICILSPAKKMEKKATLKRLSIGRKGGVQLSSYWNLRINMICLVAKSPTFFTFSRYRRTIDATLLRPENKQIQTNVIFHPSR